ncbi:MAG TPA: glycosyltransferase [Terracidiphilus sp.]|nr:glycosyltransferase [Terracidiphilus sp.]
MRLLHMVHTLNPEHGGPPESVRMFVLAHRRAGNEVEVATLDAPDSGFDKLAECPVHACGPGLKRYGYAPRLEPWLRANYARFDGAIVNGVWQYHGVVARRVLAGRKPYVVFAHGMLDPYFMRSYPVKHLKKLAYWIFEERRNLDRAQAVCFTSEEEKRIAARGFPFRHFRGVVVPYGTLGPEGDPEEQKNVFAARFASLAGRRYFLFLGRIHAKKGCDLLIEAFARSAPKDHWLVMAGPDETGLRPELEAQAEQAGVADRVLWTGMLTGRAKWGALYGAEAFILPSHQENFGIAVADALSCGAIPLISDKVNIAPDLLADGAGLVEADTLEGTERLIERFLAMSQAERGEMRRRGTDAYRRRYSLSNAAAGLYRAMGL